MMKIDIRDAVIFDDEGCAAVAEAIAHSALRGAGDTEVRAFLAFPVTRGEDRFDRRDDVLTGEAPAVVIVVGGTRTELCAAVGRMADETADSYVSSVD